MLKRRRIAKPTKSFVKSALEKCGEETLKKFDVATSQRVYEGDGTLYLEVNFDDPDGRGAALAALEEDVIRRHVPVDILYAFSTFSDLQGHTTVVFRFYPEKEGDW